MRPKFPGLTAALMVLLVSMLAGAARGQGDPAGPVPDLSTVPPPQLQQVSPRLNFGTHKPLSFLSDTITLVNADKKPLTLAKAIGECSCTDATILGNKKTIAVGEEVEILVAVEFPREMGLYTKQLFVYEEGNARPMPIPFDFEVGYPVVINGGPRNAIVIERTGEITLESRESKAFSVVSISGRAPIYNGFDPAAQLPQTRYTVLYDWSSVPSADLPRWLVIETDHPEAEMMCIAARIPGWQPVLDKKTWHPMDEFIAMGRIPPDVSSPATMLFTGKPVLPGQSITLRSSNPDLLVNVAAARRPDRGGGMVVDLNVKPRVGFTGFAATVVTVEYDGAKTGFDLFARVDRSVKAAGAAAR